MAMNQLRELKESLVRENNEIHVDREIGRRAMIPLQRMLDFPKPA
jgi:quinolinate synthase